MSEKEFAEFVQKALQLAMDLNMPGQMKRDSEQVEKNWNDVSRGFHKLFDDHLDPIHGLYILPTDDGSHFEIKITVSPKEDA